ncbi:MAG: metallophosphoesterase [Clostridia bacterium]|nr:metallophosphoesterase [Clostridia bacterium]
MQISDLQDTRLTAVDTLRFIDGALSAEKPDLIILTGDQLDVVGLWNKGNKEKNLQNVRKAIINLFSVFEKHGIPYALTFGNHDTETGVDASAQAEIYSTLKSCICFDDLNDGRPDAGTFNIPVYSSDGSGIALNFFMLDCHNSKTGGEYDGPNEEQLKWFKNISESLENVPSMVFQHIPPGEIYELMTEFDKRTKNALPAFGSRKGKYYKLNEKVTFCEYYGETPSVISDTNREFETMKEQGNVFGIFFGHDHYNGFAGNVRGIDLGYCPGAGYNTYGLKNRAVRIFEFDENNVKKYSTRIVDYSDCCKKNETAPIKNFLYCHSPSCTGMAGRFAVKCLAIIAAVIIALTLLDNYVSHILVSTFLTGLTVGLIAYGIVSITYNAILRRKLTQKRR